MTQTPLRDWQKDMEHAQFFKVDQYNGWAEPMIYWLQEAKKWRERYEQRPTFELLEAAQSLYEHHNARADAAEAREQQLRWTLERIKKITENEDQGKYYNGTIKLRNDLIDQTLSTLYPDTPAPTFKEEN